MCSASSSRTCRRTSSHRNEDELRDLLATGAVSPHIGAVYPLAETSRALRHVADGKAVGKVLIDIGGVG